ncbi:hypothetical protein MKX01_029737 [Papaver californicum]|nr:hypothetical protein MKX01_029737 [Papaver californicum]
MTQQDTPQAEVLNPQLYNLFLISFSLPFFFHTTLDPSNASNSNSKSDRRDIAWEWATSVNPKIKRVKCNLCGHKINGGINRFKNHLMQKPGDVRACSKTTPKTMKRVSESMKEKNKQRTNKERIDRLSEDLDQIMEQGDDELVELDAVNVTASKQILSKRKKIKNCEWC